MFVVSHEAKRSGVPVGQNGTPLRSVPYYKRALHFVPCLTTSDLSDQL